MSQNYIYLTLTRKSLPKGATTRLLGRSGPLGMICTAKEASDGFDVTASFKCDDVLKWLEKAEVTHD